MWVRSEGDCYNLCSKRIHYETMIYAEPSTTIEKCVRRCKQVVGKRQNIR